MTLAFSLRNDGNSKSDLNFLIQHIMDKYPKMKIVGVPPKDGKEFSQGIYNATPGSVIVISDENKFDVDWYPSVERANKKGVKVAFEFNPTKTWKQVDEFLKHYYSSNYSNDYYDSSDSHYAPYRVVCGAMAKDIHENDAYTRVGNRVFIKVNKDIAPIYVPRPTTTTTVTTITIRRRPRQSFDLGYLARFF